MRIYIVSMLTVLLRRLAHTSLQESEGEGGSPWQSTSGRNNCVRQISTFRIEN